MSTTGHYTRYINQYPGWSDNCDSMYHELDHGYLTIEHTCGNKEAFLTFSYQNPHYNYWIWKKEQTDYIGPLKAGRQFTLIDYTGNKAIQHVIEKSYKINPETLMDMIFKNEFYNRSYVDYFQYYQEQTA